MSAVRYSWPTARLHALLTRPGGMTRADAIAGAAACLEESRPPATGHALESLTAIDAVLAGAEGAELTRDQIHAILRHTDRLASIAALFDWRTLAEVSASLGELGMTLLDAPRRPTHAVAVHARAARWAAENTHLSEAETRPIVAGLLKVVARFDPRQPAERTG